MFHHVTGMEASGSRTVRTLYRNIADNDSEGPDLVISGTDFEGYTTYFEEDPIAAAPWTVQATIDMQWGLKLQA